MGAVHVAAIQFELAETVDENLRQCLDLLDRACAVRAGEPPRDLVLFPEFCNHRTAYRDQAHAYEVAIAVPGPFFDALAERTRRYGIHLCFNATVRGPEPQVFATSLLIGPDGREIGRHEKQVLFGFEQDCISVGRIESAVFATPIGRIGLYSCMDGLLPETTRVLALRGAQVLLNSLNSGGPDEETEHIPVRAAENHVWLISANKVGPIAQGHALRYAGGAQIVDPSGQVLVNAGRAGEEIIFGTIDPEQADDKRVGAGNDLLADRRPELYGLLTEPVDSVPAAQPTPPPPGLLLPRLRASAIQISSTGDLAATVEGACWLIRDVAAAGSELAVLPELFAFQPERIGDDPAAAAAASDRILGQLQAVAAETRCWTVASLVEAAGGDYYSTASLIDPTGRIAGRYRQAHLWATERRWATPGNDLPVFETPIGRVGLLIGYDGTLPEPARVLGLKGADIVAWPTTWRLDWEPRLGAVERAAENRACLIAAARADSPVQRGSQVIAVDRFPTMPHWWTRCPIPAEAAPGNGAHVSAGIQPLYARDKRVFEHTDLVRCRRPELYRSLAEPAAAGIR